MPGHLSQRLKTRIAHVFLFLVVCGGLLWLRLGYLQLVRHGFLEAEAMRQRYRSQQLVPDRGNILDRNGQPLAVTVYGFGVYAVPAAVNDPAGTARQLASLLNRPAAELEELLGRNAGSIWLTDRLDAAAAAAVEALRLPGVYVVERPQRAYPQGLLAADVLGYTGRDNQGLAGLEYLYDEVLAGVPGVHVSERDPRGRAIAGARSEVREPVPGSDLVLTIDAVLQYIVEQELARGIEDAQAQWGLAVAMQPQTGEILAMAVLPTFDPANYQRYLPRAHRNPAVADQFEPGSTLKLFTVAAALEEGVVTLDTVLDSPAQLRIGGGVIHCNYPFGYGRLTVLEAVARSCNTTLAHIGAELLGGERLYQYLRAFGFGQRLGVDLPGEGTGLVPAPGRISGELLQWATISFGQGIAVTPLQLTAATAALVNGGVLMKPYIVKEIRHPDGHVLESFSATPLRRVVSPETARDVVQTMIAVVQQGTGRRAQVAGYQVAGKTGTAQIPENGIYGDKRLASFIGFGPVDDPALVLLVMLYDVQQDATEGGLWAAPVFSNIMRRAFQHLGIPPAL